MWQKVYHRFLIELVLLFGVLFLVVPATLAGGWAVITLDQLPAEVVAGKPHSIGFMIRQHGRTPWVYGQVMVHAVHIQSHETISVQAEAEGATGHYVATLNFPQAGTWRWGIEAGLMPGQQPMPDLTVLASPQAGSLEVSTSSGAQQTLVGDSITGGSFPLSLGIGLIGSIATVGTLFFWWRKRTPLALVSLTVAAVIGIIGFSLVARASAFSREVTPNLPDRPALTASVELGQSLFVAKGCIVCHRHAAISEVRQRFGGEFVEFWAGPDLPTLATDPKLLHDWLKDPSAMKPNTDMPNPELKEAEIEALVAFLLAPKETTKEANAP
jgi:cytochrome c2